MTELKNEIIKSEIEGWYICQSYIEGIEHFFGQEEKIFFSEKTDKNGEKVLVVMDNYSTRPYVVSVKKEISIELSHEEVEIFFEEVYKNELTKKIYENGKYPSISELKAYLSEKSFDEVILAYYLFFNLLTKEEVEENKDVQFKTEKDGLWATIEAKNEKYYFANIDLEEGYTATIFWDIRSNKPILMEHYFEVLADNPMPLWLYAKDSYGDEFEFDKEEELYKKFI